GAVGVPHPAGTGGAGGGGGVAGAAGTAGAEPEVHTCSSASPTLTVAGPTEVTVNRRLVVVRGGKATTTGPPSFFSAGTATVDPSEKVSVPPVAQSSRFGRSYSTTVSTWMGSSQFSCSQLPAFPPSVAHSAVESPGKPAILPSTALAACCPLTQFCDDWVRK